MHFGFNKQFIKVTRIWPIFQKNPKKLFCFLLISGIMNLYVKRTPDIKRVAFLFDDRRVRFYPIKIRTYFLGGFFLNLRQSGPTIRKRDQTLDFDQTN